MEITLGQPVTMESLERQRAMAAPRHSATSEAPPLPFGKDYHVFFSFHENNPDYNWVKAVVRELEGRGYKCCVFPRDLDVGRSVDDNIKTVLTKCMRIVIVLSENYIKNEWKQKIEMEIISQGNLEQLVFIPVLIEPCGIPPILKYYRYINATSGRENWWEVFLRQVRGNAPHLPSKKKYHVFFAHSRADTKWVGDVVKRLETPLNSIVCCYADRDFKPGNSINDSIDIALKRSLRTILVVSQTFLMNEWKRYYEGKIKHSNAIPVIVSDCNLPLALDDIVCIDARIANNDWYDVLLRVVNEEDLLVDDDTVTSTSQFIRQKTIYTPAADPFSTLATSSQHCLT